MISIELTNIVGLTYPYTVYVCNVTVSLGSICLDSGCV